MQEEAIAGKVIDLFTLVGENARLKRLLADYLAEVQLYANDPERMSFAASRALIELEAIGR